MYMSLNEENSGNMQNKVKINKHACSSRQKYFLRTEESRKQQYSEKREIR